MAESEADLEVVCREGRCFSERRGLDNVLFLLNIVASLLRSVQQSDRGRLTASPN